MGVSIKEISRPQVLVTLGVPGVHAGHVDAHLDAALLRVLIAPTLLSVLLVRRSPRRQRST